LHTLCGILGSPHWGQLLIDFSFRASFALRLSLLVEECLLFGTGMVPSLPWNWIVELYAILTKLDQ
jgi:hypothetical protein